MPVSRTVASVLYIYIAQLGMSKCFYGENVSPCVCIICRSMCAMHVSHLVESLHHFVLSNRAASSSSVSTSCFRVPQITRGRDTFSFFSFPLRAFSDSRVIRRPFQNKTVDWKMPTWR